MPATHPRSGLRARLSRRVHGVLAFAVSLGLAGAALSGTSIPAAAETVEEPADGVVRLSLSAGVNGVVEVGDPVLATATVRNGTTDEVSAGRLLLEINRTPITESTALTLWTALGAYEGTFSPLGNGNTRPVDPEDDATASVLIDEEDLGDLHAGVYPIRAELNGATTGDTVSGTLTAQDPTARNVLIVSDDADTRLGVVVPITATPESGELLTGEELSVLTAPDGALTAQLDGVGGTAAILAVDPAILAAIRVLGSSAPQTALDWLLRLNALPNERFALQFGDADATTQAQAGLDALLDPPALDTYLDPIDFVPTATTPAPASTPEPTEPNLPGTEELTHLEGAERGVLWPRGDATSDDLAMFARGSSASETTTILPSTSVRSPDSAVGTVDGERVLLTNSAASAAFSTATATIDPEARQSALAEAIALLALGDPAEPLLIGLARSEDRTADALRDTIAAIDGRGDMVGLDDLLAENAPAIEVVTDPDASRGPALERLLADEEELTAFSSILDDPMLLMAPERIQIMRTISVGSVSGEFAAEVETHREQTRTTLDAVGIQPPSPVQLISAAAPLPVWVRNDLPWPVNVRLSAQPSDPRLAVQPFVEVEALAASNTRVLVPVEARVGSGELVVGFDLASPTGVPIGPPQSANVTVRADWESIGLVVLGGLVVLLFGVGLTRTVIRRRRDRTEEESADDADDPAAEPTDAEPTDRDGDA
ncbi:MAG: DUF6049 family protein [Actinomycetota bacterium]